MTEQAEKELEVLETIHTAKEENRPVVQRDIAHIIGMSLGMTNSIIKRLVKKGLLKMKKVNNRTIHYIVSPEGLKAIAEKSYGYLKRTIKNVVYYKEKIEDIVRSAEEQDIKEIILVGNSDLDFIVEHFCGKYDLTFRRVRKETPFSIDSPEHRLLILYSESYDATAEKQGELFANSSRVESLRQLML